jgi:hypothetical protein
MESQNIRKTLESQWVESLSVATKTDLIVMMLFTGQGLKFPQAAFSPGRGPGNLSEAKDYFIYEIKLLRRLSENITTAYKKGYVTGSWATKLHRWVLARTEAATFASNMAEFNGVEVSRIDYLMFVRDAYEAVPYPSVFIKGSENVSLSPEIDWVGSASSVDPSSATPMSP